MIMLLNRRSPIRFSPWKHGLAAAWDGLRRLKNRRRPPGGAQIVAANLRRELAEQTLWHWAECFRDHPVEGAVDVVWVVGGVGDLLWTIRHKARLGAKQLWAGPNIAVVPQEAGGALLSDQVDRFMSPCKWVGDFYQEQALNLRGKVHIWPVGIDTDYWAPDASEKRYLLIYKKSPDCFSAVAAAVARRRIPYQVVAYGSYTPEGYRECLREAWGMIWLSGSETQGLALLEAMSMNVPTLAWDPGTWSYTSPELGKSFRCASSSTPYFDARCGETFGDAAHLEDRLDQFRNRLPTYRPRAYVLESHLDLASNLEAWGVFRGV